MMKRLGISAVIATLACCVGVAACTQTDRQKHPEDSEHPKTTSPNVMQNLDPKLYWYYDGMKRLRNVRQQGDQIKGEFIDRNIPFNFTVDAAKVQDSATRTEGYKMAIQRIVSYLKPGKFSDSEDSQRQLKELEDSMKAMTGLDLSGYDAWNRWYQENGAKLKWDSDKNRLVAE